MTIHGRIITISSDEIIMHKDNIKDLLIYLTELNDKKEIARTEIVGAFENSLELIELFKQDDFKGVESASIPQKFHVDKLIGVVATHCETAGWVIDMNDDGKVVSMTFSGDADEEMSVDEPSNKSGDHVGSELNAANDPNLKTMIKTKSYMQLEELIDPETPINIYLSGETGLGKSTAVMRICQELGLPVVRVSLSFTTDVDDLVGGLRLEGGDTEVEFGPVIQAMQMGAVLLLDEVDAANPRILMELQAVMELNGYLHKKANQVIYPAPGFRVIATGNSKGMGDETGEFIGVTPLNKAFRDRFATYVDFIYPNEKEMKRILTSRVPGLDDDAYEGLSMWYGQILSAKEGGVNTDVVSPRRMIEVAKMFKVFRVTDIEHEDVKNKVLTYSLNFFEERLSGSFINLWDQMISTTAASRRNKKRGSATKKPAADSKFGNLFQMENGDSNPLAMIING